MSAALLIAAALLAAIVVAVWAIASAAVDAAGALKTLAAIANRAEDRELVRANMVAGEREDRDR